MSTTTLTRPAKVARGLRAHSMQTKNSRSGFTLSELLVAITVSGVILAACVSSLNLLARSYTNVRARVEMNAQCRRAMDHFARDARMGDGVTAATDTSLTLRIYSNATSGTELVEYSYDASTGTLSRANSGVTINLVNNLSNFDFDYFDSNGSPTTTTNAIKCVQINALASFTVLDAERSRPLITARYIIRNAK